MGKTKTDPQSLSFEDQLLRLETIVQTLESGNIGLDESLKLYEEGIILSKNCLQALNQAEAKVVTLQKKLNEDV
ncbi:MAG: exodeoxyribonuclease VII small subunit [Bacteroidetes bacterium]|nr:exodeoxyribonuclease VII small subunit [Bacteroidota bacterium]